MLQKNKDHLCNSIAEPHPYPIESGCQYVEGGDDVWRIEKANRIAGTLARWLRLEWLSGNFTTTKVAVFSSSACMAFILSKLFP